MLIFTKLILENIGPFKGHQEIEFGRQDGVTIIWGENGRGKTTLLNYIRFVLFDKMPDAEINYLKMCNIEGFREGHYNFSVSLEMENDGIPYVLKREIRTRKGVAVPTKNNDYIETMYLEKDGFQLGQAESQHELKYIMPEDVSRFFLFDAELLQQYSDLLDDNSDDGRKIKSSIEKILGMPVLTSAVADIIELTEEYQTKKNKVIQNDKNIQDLSTQYQTITDRKHYQQQQRDKDSAELERKEKELTDIQKKMNETAKLRALLSEERIRKEDKNKKDNNLDECNSQLQTEMHYAWQSLIKNVILEEIETSKNQSEEFREKNKNAAISRSMVKEIEDTIKNKECTICGQPVSESVIEALKDKLNELNSHSVKLTPEEKNKLDVLTKKINMLQDLNLKDNKSRIQVLVEKSENLSVEIASLSNEISELQQQIATYGKYDPNALNLVDDYSKCKKQIDILRSSITDTDKEIEKDTASLKQLDTRINQMSRNQDVQLASHKLEICQAFEDIFSSSIDIYRRKLADEVEKDASDFFVQMSADKDYIRLKINDNYGLKIIHKDEIEVPNRSAGFEHVVALSLIGALHKNSPLQGPVVMDSAFGRLSIEHKKNVTKELPALANQVILLVYKGEIDEKITHDILRGHIVHEYELKYVSSFDTQIEEKL